ncbi:MAG: hypothetical protein JO359_04735 [Candidatus Eremiobacteraeota bacterium]|nr:hypothetical protein [Candidatus Eremiobacteraeota bacterium]
MLSGTGFRDVEIIRRDIPLRYGARGAEREAAEHIASIGGVGRLLASVDAAGKAAAVEAIRRLFEDHATAEGIVFESSTWLVSATQ